MPPPEFDKYAAQYESLHQENIKASGYTPAFFAEYKVQAVANLTADWDLPSPPNILDFGTGIGSSLPFFNQYFPASELVALDISKRSLEFAQNTGALQTNFVCFNGDTIPISDATFDIAFSACVFHHINHNKHVSLLRELLRVLKPNGFLILFEHNPFNPLTVRAVDTCPFDENARLVSAVELSKRMIQAGSIKTKTSYQIFFPYGLRFFRGLETLLHWLPLGAQYYVWTRK